MADADHVARTCLQAYAALPKGGGKPQKRSNGRYASSLM